MRLPVLLFALLLGLCGLFVVFAALDEHPDARGQQHPEFATMQQGGDPGRHRSMLPWGAAYVGLQILLFVGLIALGIGPRRLARARRDLTLVLIAYLGVFAMLILSYQRFAAGDMERLVLGFPVPSAWMLFGVWPVPLLLVWFYVSHFDRWVMGKDDLAEFRRLVERRQAADAEERS